MFKTQRSYLVFSALFLAAYVALCAFTEFRWRDLVLIGFVVAFAVAGYRRRSPRPPLSS